MLLGLVPMIEHVIDKIKKRENKHKEDNCLQLYHNHKYNIYYLGILVRGGLAVYQGTLPYMATDQNINVGLQS